MSATQTRTWLVVHAPTAGTFEVFGNATCDADADPEAEQVLFSRTVIAPGSQVITVLGRRELTGFRVAFTGLDPKTSRSSECMSAQSDLPDADGDGIPDVIEAAGPNPAAADTGRETQVPTDTGDWVTLQIAAGNLREVMPVDDPSPTIRPEGLTLPSGLFSFQVTAIEPGSSVDVNVILPQSDASTDYWKFGRTAAGQAASWYRFGFDPTTGVGAQRTTFVHASEIHPGFTLHFIDGLTGDEDGLANGAIVDPGGPGFGAAGDTTAPMITCPANVSFALGVPVVLGTATATDLDDPQPVVANDAPATYAVGATVVSWSATDASGNGATCTQVVTVVASTALLRFDGFFVLGARRITPTTFEATPGRAVVVSWRLRDERGAQRHHPGRGPLGNADRARRSTGRHSRDTRAGCICHRHPDQEGLGRQSGHLDRHAFGQHGAHGRASRPPHRTFVEMTSPGPNVVPDPRPRVSRSGHPSPRFA